MSKLKTKHKVLHKEISTSVPPPLRSVPFWPAEPEEHGDALWGYEAELADGPEHWGTIRKLSDNSIAYPACAGLSQSPIDILAAEGAVPVVPLITNYTPHVDFQILARPGGHPGFQVS